MRNDEVYYSVWNYSMNEMAIRSSNQKVAYWKLVMKYSMTKVLLSVLMSNEKCNMSIIQCIVMCVCEMT